MAPTGDFVLDFRRGYPVLGMACSGRDMNAKPRIVGHTELCLFLLPFLQQGDFTVEALVSAILADFQVIDRDTLPVDAAEQKPR